VGGRTAVDTARAEAAPAFAPDIPVAAADEPIEDVIAAETPADTPEDVIAAETPAAPSTPNEEGAVT